MNSASLELFKRALAEGTDIRFRKAAEADADAMACSARHLEIMERIMSGTYRKPISLSSVRIKIAAAIAAVMLLLSGCAMIYKDEIRGFIEHIYEEYIEISFSDGENKESSSIKEIYELTYVPEGFVLKTEFISNSTVSYTFDNKNGHSLTFNQYILDGSSFNFDSERSDSTLIIVGKYNIYFTNTKQHHSYIWNDGKYAMIITSSEELSDSELQKIIEGIKTR